MFKFYEDVLKKQVELENIEKWNVNLPIPTFMIIFVIIMFFIVLYFMFNYLRKCKATPNQGDTFIQRGEELCNINPY